jgi:hypothetical protein
MNGKKASFIRIESPLIKVFFITLILAQSKELDLTSLKTHIRTDTW